MSGDILSLEHLMVSTVGLDGAAIEVQARNLYSSLYLNRGHVGVHHTHDDAVVIFHQSQFEHAFFTTSDKLCHPERKDCLRTGSVERIKWIAPLVAGRVTGSACFEVPSP